MNTSLLPPLLSFLSLSPSSPHSPLLPSLPPFAPSFPPFLPFLPPSRPSLSSFSPSYPLSFLPSLPPTLSPSYPLSLLPSRPLPLLYLSLPPSLPPYPPSLSLLLLRVSFHYQGGDEEDDWCRGIHRVGGVFRKHVRNKVTMTTVTYPPFILSFLCFCLLSSSLLFHPPLPSPPLPSPSPLLSILFKVMYFSDYIVAKLFTNCLEIDFRGGKTFANLR